MERPLRHTEEELLFKGKRNFEKELLFKGENIHCRNEPLYNKGRGDLLVYRGYFKRAEDLKEEIVVRKIKKTDCCDQWKDIFTKHTREKDPIKHENVLKIIGYEENNEWRYFALERYNASLEQFCKGFYKGPMPSDAQVLCQIAKGLLYLHKVRCSHGNLTPRTILIASSQPVRIKLSEFGLSKFGDQCDEKLGQEQEDLCQRKYWKSDGTTTDSYQQTPTPNQDIFAAGCVSFYFLKRGVHPFGDDSSSILENIKKRNPVNLLPTLQQEKGIWEFAYEPIKNMIGDPPTDGYNWLTIAEEEFMKALSLKVDVENELGRGGFGVVYEGTFDGNPVAVKEFNRSHYAIKKEQKREMEEHVRLDHENVLKLLHVDDSRDKTYLVLELCAGTLTNYWEKKYNKLMPPTGIILYQIANGLHYIHSQNLVHRDVKTDNILISMTTPIQMKLSDFGFVKKTSPQGTFSLSGLKGTEKWMAPEILGYRSTSTNKLPHGTIQSDTFAAGCVFFYVLTRGRHPFDEPIRTHNPSENPDEQIRKNVLNNKPTALDIELKQKLLNIFLMQGDDRALYELIEKMIEPIKQRISLPKVIEQLTTNLTASRKFKRVARLVREEGGKCVSRFHPKKPVLACGIKNEIIFLSAENSSIPFPNWKEDEKKFQIGHIKDINTMEWNADGTQLAAAAFFDENVIVWSYPSGAILFQEKLNQPMNRIEWNPFRPNVFAAFRRFPTFGKVFLIDSCPVEQRQFHFCTIKCEKEIESVQWISANRVALGLREYGRIEIWEIDESTTFAKFVKRLEHESGSIREMAWDERTKCLAACSLDGWMTIWSMDIDQPIHATFVDGDVTCRSLAWRPNGKPTDDEGGEAARKSADNFILACGLDEGEIVIWTPLAKEKTRILINQHSSWEVDSLSFSPDGLFLASADYKDKWISTESITLIWATENWQPVYIDKKISWSDRFSWLSSSSTDVPDYKLTFDSYDGGKVRVVEYAVGLSEKPSKKSPGQFKKSERSMSERGSFFCRFHPTELVLACGVNDHVILLSADNSSIPFSNWKEMETQLQHGNFEELETIEWNVDGTQLAAAAISHKDVIVWSYPSGAILFQKKLNDEKMHQIEWNPFRPNVFAILGSIYAIKDFIFFFNSCPVGPRQFHFHTIESERGIRSVQWISENRVALSSRGGGGGIEIWEIDESTTFAKFVKRLEHESGWITGMAWNERTKCLAACSYNKWMTIWSMDIDQPIHATFVDGDVTCRSLAWRPNGKPTDDEGVEAARKSADNFILACGLDEGEIVIWTPLAKEKTRILNQLSRSVESLSFSPDGRFLALDIDSKLLIIWETEIWEPVYIEKKKIWDKRFSWLSSSSTDAPDYKLTFNSYSNKVYVIEYAVGQSEKPSIDKSDMSERIAEKQETRGEWSIGSSEDLK